MEPVRALFLSLSRPILSRSSLTVALLLAAAFGAGCSNMSSMITPPPQNTTVVVMASSTANAQLSQMDITLNSLSLTTQSGQTVSVFNTPQQAEFIHLNGTAEPLTSASIPQGVYTSASATVQFPQVTCLTLESNGSLLSDEFQSRTAPVVTVTLPAPIRVTGTAMGLLLNLQVSPSVMPATCPITQTNPVINTVFNVTPVTFVAQPSSVQNGKLNNLQGLISAVDTMNSRITVAGNDGPSWIVRSDTNTQYQRVAAFSTLAVGMPVDFDVALQSDGSLLATRVEVPDPNPANLSVVDGPVVFVATLVPALFQYTQQDQGLLFTTGKMDAPFPFSFGNATFQVSGSLANVQSLPFSATLTANNMFAGQNTFFTSHAQTIAPEPTYAAASTVTLTPQTINGVITATGTDGVFTTYTVSLAAYDLISQLAVQAGQTTVLNNPSTVTVYVDSGTQMLNSRQLAVGTVFRFNGLLFNDNGTLRLDAAQINDGVLQ